MPKYQTWMLLLQLFVYQEHDVSNRQVMLLGLFPKNANWPASKFVLFFKPNRLAFASGSILK